MFLPKKAIREVIVDRYENLSEWILKELEGTLSASEFHAMEDLLRSDSEALDYYINSYFSISYFMEPFQMPQDIVDVDKNNIADSQLWKELAEIERSAETVKIVPRREEPALQMILPAQRQHSISRMSIVSIVISMAALIMLLAYVVLNPRTSGTVVGVMVDTVGATWQDETTAIQAGQDVRKGPLYLRKGLARIRFDSGAGVILEGPAQVELLSSNSMYVREGKIVATVGREAIGFVVNTPQGKILDLGTEFGIRVEPAGQSQVHVFQGEVVLYPMDDKGYLNVSQGLAKSVDQNGQVMDIPVQTESFVRPDEMSSKLLARTGSSYHRWKAWVFEIHRDPSLVAHYFGIKDQARPDSLVNSAPLTSGHLAGRFGTQGRTSPTWVTGRWAEKPAVQFERGKNQAIVIDVEDALRLNNQISISTWVYYPNDKQRGGHLVSCRRGFHVYYQFAIFDEHYFYADQRNRLEFLRLNEDGDRGLYSREFIQRAGTWYHFVVTYDTQNVSFYVNGQLYYTRSYPVAAQSNTVEAELIIGAMKARLQDRFTLPEGDFDGILDELMIFKRCLNADEIESMYEVGVPISK
jgi:hypothetical protein